jgi:spore coat protein U-like protein
MKKLISIPLFALLALGFVQSARAENFANVSLSVTLSGEMTVLIVGSTVTTFGSLGVSSSAVSATGITVMNGSQGIPLTYGLKSFNSGNVGDPGTWTLGATPGSNQYALRGLFNNARPALAAFNDTNDRILTAPAFPNAGWFGRSATVAAGGTGAFEGDQNGVSVLPGTERNLWFKLFTPTISNSIGQRELTVTVQGLLPGNFVNGSEQ